MMLIYQRFGNFESIQSELAFKYRIEFIGDAIDKPEGKN